MKYLEINFDGLVGPTHNYAGLSVGNVASLKHKGDVSNPKAAALQGLEKAKALADRGVPQAILPPHPRPSIRTLHNWGFVGKTDEAVLSEAFQTAPQLLAAATSASAMWTANACTMTPAIDSKDDRAHFTPANLVENIHRSIEASFTQQVLKAIFADEERFAVHQPLTGGRGMADEGAANHTRLCQNLSSKGLHLFVYGRSALESGLPQPRKFHARQTRESFEAIARLHGIPKEQQIFLQQSPAAIDAGVFHNDVIAVGHQNLLFLHEDAFLNQPEALAALQAAFLQLNEAPLQLIEVGRNQVSLRDAVDTYLFNSQLLDLENNQRLLVVPSECSENKRVSALLEQIVADPENSIAEVLAFDLKESMRNGGGPACLRQRVVLNVNEIRHIKGRILLDQSLYFDLKAWIERHYRDSLAPSELADPSLLEESNRALDELGQLMHLPELYAFQ